MKKKPREQVAVPCACGRCNEMVLTPSEWGYPVKYVKGHSNKGKRGAECGWYGKGEYTHLREIEVPCACGQCSEMVKVYKRGRKLRSFVKGHQMCGRVSNRKGTGKANSNEIIVCACGCKRTRKRFDKWGTEYKYIRGHKPFGWTSPLLGKKQPSSQREKLSLYRANHPELIPADRGKMIEYKGIQFRSYAEAERAEQLDALGYHWAFEPAGWFAYVDGDGLGRRYKPDFWIEELQCFEEVKGYYYYRPQYRYARAERDRIKMRLVMEQNPNAKIVIVDRERLNRVRMELRKKGIALVYGHQGKKKSKQQSKKESGNETV